MVADAEAITSRELRVSLTTAPPPHRITEINVTLVSCFIAAIFSLYRLDYIVLVDK